MLESLYSPLSPILGTGEPGSTLHFGLHLNRRLCLVRDRLTDPCQRSDSVEQSADAAGWHGVDASFELAEENAMFRLRAGIHRCQTCCPRYACCP